LQKKPSRLQENHPQVKFNLNLNICLYILILNKDLDIIGEAFNTDNKPVVAISYGVGNTGKYTLPENVSFMKPEMVTSIPDVIPPPKPGPLEAVDEVK
jgi:hypothetical protein